MNKLLLRQIEKHLSAEIRQLPELASFLKVINDSYDHYEKDRKMLERSIDLSSNEMIELNTKLRKESEELNSAELNEAQQIAKLGSWVVDKNERKTLYSAELYSILEQTPGQILLNFKGILQSVHPDDKARLNRVFEQSLSAHQPFSSEARIVTPNGQVKNVLIQAKIIEDEQGELTRVHGTVQDITEQKQAEIALQKANSQIQTLFENIEEVFFSVDMVHLQLLQISPSCEKVYGCPRQDFIDNPMLWQQVIMDEDAEVIEANDALMRAGKSFIHEHKIHYQNQTVRWLETKISPTLDKEGNLIRIDGITSNITERKLVEGALTANNTELKKTNSELDKFVYSVSHDLRAPLTSMLGIIEMSEEETTDALTQKHLGMLKRSVKKLDGFILDILDYSRNARTEVKKEKINFHELLEDITANLKYMSTGNRQVDIRTTINNGVLFTSDKGRLGMILNNLISNAIRYQNPNVPVPFIEILVNLTNDSALIEIKDNGIGISEENHDKVFDMFYRVSNKSVGSGLGLYIVKETVDKLNGKIEITSELNKGTTFTIHIPNN